MCSGAGSRIYILGEWMRSGMVLTMLLPELPFLSSAYRSPKSLHCYEREEASTCVWA
jgi:hypothetical protein